MRASATSPKYSGGYPRRVIREYNEGTHKVFFRESGFGAGARKRAGRASGESLCHIVTNMFRGGTTFARHHLASLEQVAIKGLDCAGRRQMQGARCKGR